MELLPKYLFIYLLGKEWKYPKSTGAVFEGEEVTKD